MVQHTLQHRRGLALAVSILVAASLLGACKSSDTNTSTSATNAPTTTAASSSGTTGKSTGGTTTQGTSTKGTVQSGTSLDTKVWWNGFRYDLADVVADKDTQVLTIKTKITNLGADPAAPYPPVSLVNGGSEVAKGGLKESPSITGGKTVDGAFEFNVKEDFTVAGTTFLITEGSSTVEVKVPLDGKGDKVTLEPIEQAQTPDPLTMGSLTLTINKAEIRWDIPQDHSIEAEAGTTFLILSGAAKNDGENAAYFNPAGITVTTSTGTYPVKFISDQSIPPKQTDDKLAFYFQIKDPVEGDWTIDFKDQPIGPDGTNISAVMKVVVSKQKKGGAGTTTTTK